jgi:DtxR family Mn-dependent transcriptional regulator
LRKKTIEDYVEQLYYLEKVKSPVHTNDIANSLDINPASVTEILKKLNNERYINYEKYEGATLTNKGLKLAKQIKNKHDRITEFLIILGVNKKIAEKDACEMEHILHPSTMDIIIKFVEIFNTCDLTPFWLGRLREYVKTDKIPKCPTEISELCLRYSKK